MRRSTQPRPSNPGAAIPPPPSCLTNSRGSFTTTAALNQKEFQVNLAMRNRTEDQYFEEEDEPLNYIPAPGSPSAGGQDDSDSDDPLDAFMKGIEKEIKQPQPKSEEKAGVRDDIELEDDEESYYRYVAENPNLNRESDSEGEGIEYDEDGNPIAPKKSKWIDPLPPIDHSQIKYQPFEKNFYIEHEDIKNLNEVQVNELRTEIGLTVSGASIPKPVTSFAHLQFPEILLKSIRKSEFTQPTPIQSQGLPILMQGRDIIGIAKTGSGKTAAFIWPMLLHISDQPELKEGDGPIGLILCPTRELALQIYNETKKYSSKFNLLVTCLYGGGSKYEQSESLKAGVHIVIATPGRMIDFIKGKATNLERVTYLVLDEADRMFDMGFEVQVRSICAHVRSDRQISLFSATFKKKIEKLVRDVLVDAIRVGQGDLETNKDITQFVFIHPLGGAKWNWMIKSLVQFQSNGSVLIFVTKKANAEELHANLKLMEIDCLLLHGDMDQIERNSVITRFRKKEYDLLVATDVAARGLDIPHIRTVINFDVARDIDTHTHRIGRTGRAGQKGTAYTLITEKDKEFAGHLVRNLEGNGQIVSSELMDLAMKSAWFKSSRFKSGQGKTFKLTTRGLGYKEKSGTGASGGIPGIIGQSNYISIPVIPPVGGPAAGRLGALKAAFMQQYSSQFRLSEDAPPPSATLMPAPAAIPPPSDETKRKKSRWGD